MKLRNGPGGFRLLYRMRLKRALQKGSNGMNLGLVFVLLNFVYVNEGSIGYILL